MPTDDAAQAPQLNERQRRFAELYAATGNASKAAIGAGYSPKSAPTNADKLLKNRNVQAYLRQLAQTASEGRIASAQERQEFWTAVMRGQVLVKVKDGSGKETGYEQSVDVQYRLKASELLGKAQADFVDRVEHSGDLGVIGIEVIAPDRP